MMGQQVVMGGTGNGFKQTIEDKRGGAYGANINQ